MLLQSWFLLAWLFVLGTIIGSFLNVVVYRLPLGLSLVRPGSQCPKCGHPIRWYDNVPVFGWLWLRGRCRDCGAAISVRYPLVELAVGLIFLSLGWTDWVRPQQRAWEAEEAAAVQAAVQQNTPNGADATAGGALNRVEPELNTALFAWRLIFHLLLLCPLLAAALIDADGQRLPRRLITWPAGGGILIAMFWPAVQAFALWSSHPAAPERESLSALATSFVGMLTAVVLRLAIQRFLGVIRAREMGLWNCTLALYAVGAFLGWQAVLAIGGAAMVWSFIRQAPQLKDALMHIRPTAVAFIATLGWCFAEGWLVAGG